MGYFCHPFAAEGKLILERSSGNLQEIWNGGSSFWFMPDSLRRKPSRNFEDLTETYGVGGGPISGCFFGTQSLEAAFQNHETLNTLAQPLEG